MQHILAIGDSFTYGEELSDLKLAWPHLLGLHLKTAVTNLGEPASSNDKILRKLVERIINPLEDKIDLVVIGWSDPGRSEFADEHGTYDLWPGYAGSMFHRDGSVWRKELCEYVSRYHSSAFYHKKFLQQILLAQSFLEARGIKYIMVNSVNNDYYKKVYFDELPYYEQQVNKDQFIGYRTEGMVEWANDCPKGRYEHFLEEGHEIVANKIYEHIRHLGWVS